MGAVPKGLVLSGGSLGEMFEGRDGWQTMSDDKVTIDPEFLPSQHGRDPENGKPLRWIGIGAMVVAVLVLGWVLRSLEPGSTEHFGSNGPRATSLADTSAPFSVVRLDALDLPLGEAVPGFADTITALIWGNHGVDVLQWPAAQPGPEIMLSLDHEGGWNRAVDSSGRWFVEMGPYSTLMVHRVNDHDLPSPRRPQSAEIGWSAVWHDTRPGRLAWLGCLTGAPGSFGALYTADVTRPGAEPVALPLYDFVCEDPAVWLTRWGDWGTLLQMAEGSGTTQVLLNADGAEVTRGRLGPDGEWFVGPGPVGATIWTEGLGRTGASSFVLSPDDGERRPVPGLARGERLESALASPDGSLLALVPDLEANYGSVVRIVEVDTGSVVSEIEQPSWWVTRMVWSTDGRFIVFERWPDVTSNWAGVPEDVELVFFDTESQSGVALPLPGYAPALRSGA